MKMMLYRVEDNKDSNTGKRGPDHSIDERKTKGENPSHVCKGIEKATTSFCV